jgi:hypothetical protein
MVVCARATIPDPRPPFQSTAAASPQQRLSDLESETTRVRLGVLQLEQKRIPLKREINAQSPILRLPPEITSEIFLSYLANHPWNALNANFQTLLISMTPLLFGRICSAWRELAWSIPMLWCSIQLDLRRGGMDLVLLDQWFNRSARLPLLICAFLEYDDEPSPSIVAIMLAIAQHSERWHKVDFELPLLCYTALQGVQSRLPLLQHIAIHILLPHDGAKLDLFSVAPQLQGVQLEDIDLHYLLLPTVQLTDVSIHRVNIDECLDFLRRSPHVVNCAFEALAASDFGDRFDHVHADQIEVLKLGFAEYDNPISEPTFDAFTIPAAREFICYANGDNFPHSSFISLITRS